MNKSGVQNATDLDKYCVLSLPILIIFELNDQRTYFVVQGAMY